MELSLGRKISEEEEVRSALIKLPSDLCLILSSWRMMCTSIFFFGKLTTRLLTVIHCMTFSGKTFGRGTETGKRREQETDRDAGSGM